MVTIVVLVAAAVAVVFALAAVTHRSPVINVLSLARDGAAFRDKIVARTIPTRAPIGRNFFTRSSISHVGSLFVT